MKPLAPNTLLQNRYLIVQLIGKGGMGEVYLAVDQRLGSAVALKRTFFSDDEQLGSAFEREARTLARLRHPVLPKVSDHFTENETQYLVMEHISGDDLSKRLEMSKKPFPLNWVLFWADQLLDALAYLHSHEPPIVHRDIKPQNLKLTAENHIILLDFGLAKNSAGSTRVTTGGSIVGYTPHYAPMEQIRGTGTTARSDIYSLAATLYQLLTAEVPPDALTRADYILNSLPDPVKPLNELNPEVPKAISDVIIKAMALSADQRYASARDMQKALRDAYSQIQNQMSAQTMAFNVPQQGEQTAPPASHPISQAPPPSSLKTEQFVGGDADGQSSSQSVSSSASSQPQMFEKTEVLENPAPSVDFDMTLRDDAFAPTSLPQSQQKTEVLPADVSAQLKSQQESFRQDQPENLDSQPEPQENFSPEATVPLINFDKSVTGGDVGATQAAQGYDSIPTTTPNTPQPEYGSPYNSEATSAAVGQTQPVGAFNSPQQVNSQPHQLRAEAATAKSGGSGKGLMIVGILGLLAVVVLAAAGIGLYAFGEQLGITTGAEPTPQPTASVAPTPEPTIEQANTDTGNTSPEETPEETVATTSDSNKSENTDVKTTEERVTDTPSVTPVRTTVPTPKPTQAGTKPVKTPSRETVISKPSTPKSSTPKPGRTDILQ